MSESTITHHDLDHIDRRIARFNELEEDQARRAYVAVQIVESIQMDALLNELRCLRERVLSPCTDPLGHTHAREA